MHRVGQLNPWLVGLVILLVLVFAISIAAAQERAEVHAMPPDEPSEPLARAGCNACHEPVGLTKENQALQRLFSERCVGCHPAPELEKPFCFVGLSRAGHITAQPECFANLNSKDTASIDRYLELGTQGRALYAAECGGCHEPLPPAEHSLEFWTAHLCNADQHLSEEQMQQLLLYLYASAKQ
jgi:predicted CXXCH cytochrome family protein